MDKPLVILVSGASSGIGRAIVETLTREGHRVIGTSRRASGYPEKAADPGGAAMIPLDVTDQSSVDQAVSYVYEQYGRLDVLVNNAGFGVAGSVEDTSPEEAFAQFDTNFFGVHRMVRAVLPLMRAQGSGRIVTVGSVAAILTVPYQGLYSATKHALEALMEAIRIECWSFGIKGVLVEPGDTKTGFTGSRVYCEDTADSPYCEAFQKAMKTIERSEQGGSGLFRRFTCHSPKKVAKTVCRAVRRKNPPVRITVGAAYKLAVFLKRLMPDRVAEFFVGNVYKSDI